MKHDEYLFLFSSFLLLLLLLVVSMTLIKLLTFYIYILFAAGATPNCKREEGDEIIIIKREKL